MKNIDKKIKWYFIFTFALAIAINIKDSLYSNAQHWGLTEWLINYSGGFVRRGLPGEVIQLLNFDPRMTAIFISFIALIFLLRYLYLNSKHYFDFYIILSPVFMGFVYYGGVLRKDILLMLTLAFLLKNIVSNGYVILSVLLITFGILSHELFFFVSIPIITVFLIYNKKPPINYLAFSIYPTLLMIFLIFYKGDITIATAINDSWSVSFDQYCSSCNNSVPSAAIGAISWTASKGLSLSASLLKSPITIFTWLIIIAACYFISLGLIKREKDKFSWASIMAFQFISISPLFIVGWDFGRWINIWMISSLLIIINFRNYLPKFNFPIGEKIIPTSKLPILFLIVPGCCISVVSMISTHPLGKLAALVLTPFKNNIRPFLNQIGLL
jgi:hypothetical protein